jgi:roadblock/LC7 domain-containing protein
MTTTVKSRRWPADTNRPARLVNPGHRVTYARKFAIAMAFATLATSGIAAATASPWQPGPGSPHQPGPPHTPNQCIRLNGGDYNACNVGNSGAGNKPYEPVHALTPNDCIRINGGDYNACNVGNSGRGDLPYQPPR